MSLINEQNVLSVWFGLARRMRFPKCRARISDRPAVCSRSGLYSKFPRLRSRRRVSASRMGVAHGPASAGCESDVVVEHGLGETVKALAKQQKQGRRMRQSNASFGYILVGGKEK